MSRIPGPISWPEVIHIHSKKILLDTFPFLTQTTLANFHRNYVFVAILCFLLLSCWNHIQTFVGVFDLLQLWSKQTFKCYTLWKLQVIREGLPRKNCSSFGFCPNFLTLLLRRWNEIRALYYVKSILTEILASRQDKMVLQKSKIIRIKFLGIWGMLQTSRYV